MLKNQTKSNFFKLLVQIQKSAVALFFLILVPGFSSLNAQTPEYETVQINLEEEHQTITGFGASLAYYENWLTAHPYRSEIYNVIFSELSLDILRVRNAYGYDSGMIDRVKQFYTAANNSLGHPIDIMVTSWGPPAYVKSNNDRNNGGTIKYTIEDGKVKFDYDAFATWWNESLDDYNKNGIYPKYIGIQNEPDFKAPYESCLLQPLEKITSTDTIAGFNKALDAVYDTVMQRENPPLFLGPECVGIGYNAVENYVNALDLSKLYGIAHHLYHGAEGGTVTGDPFTSTNYQKVGNFHPEVPHFQTEYSRADWFSVAAMMYMTLAVENATAFLYWDLIWVDGGGLVTVEFPWDKTRWTTAKGYYRTKDYYVFKHYSAFIHPGWKRIGTSEINSQLKTAAFLSSTTDSAAFVVINRSKTDSFQIRLNIPGFTIDEATAYSTDENTDFAEMDYMIDTLINVAPASINTIDLRLSKVNTSAVEKPLDTNKKLLKVSNFPNPFSVSTNLNFETDRGTDFSLEVYDITGKLILSKKMGYLPAGNHFYSFKRNGLDSGIYIYQLKNTEGKTGFGRFIISE